MNPYPIEELSEDEDDGTMPSNVAELARAVVGHRIKSAQRVPAPYDQQAMEITLDDGTVVEMHDDGDCCAYTNLESFLLHADRIDHIITGVGTTDGYETWHVFADFGDVMEMRVGWSGGNVGYYGYGFDIRVRAPEPTLPPPAPSPPRGAKPV